MRDIPVHAEVALPVSPMPSNGRGVVQPGGFARRALPFGVRHLTRVEKGCRLAEGLPRDEQNMPWLPHKGPRVPRAKPPALANADER